MSYIGKKTYWPGEIRVRFSRPLFLSFYLFSKEQAVPPFSFVEKKNSLRGIILFSSFLPSFFRSFLLSCLRRIRLLLEQYFTLFPYLLDFPAGPEEPYGRRNQSFASCPFITGDFIYFSFLIASDQGLSFLAGTKSRCLCRFIPFRDAKFRWSREHEFLPTDQRGWQELRTRAFEAKVSIVPFLPLGSSVSHWPGRSTDPVRYFTPKAIIYIYIYFCFIHMYHLVLSPTLGVQ